MWEIVMHLDFTFHLFKKKNKVVWKNNGKKELIWN